MRLLLRTPKGPKLRVKIGNQAGTIRDDRSKPVRTWKVGRQREFRSRAMSCSGVKRAREGLTLLVVDTESELRANINLPCSGNPSTYGASSAAAGKGAGASSGSPFQDPLRSG